MKKRILLLLCLTLLLALALGVGTALGDGAVATATFKLGEGEDAQTLTATLLEPDADDLYSIDAIHGTGDSWYYIEIDDDWEAVQLGDVEVDFDGDLFTGYVNAYPCSVKEDVATCEVPTDWYMWADSVRQNGGTRDPKSETEEYLLFRVHNDNSTEAEIAFSFTAQAALVDRPIYIPVGDDDAPECLIGFVKPAEAPGEQTLTLEGHGTMLADGGANIYDLQLGVVENEDGNDQPYGEEVLRQASELSLPAATDMNEDITNVEWELRQTPSDSHSRCLANDGDILRAQFRLCAAATSYQLCAKVTYKFDDMTEEQTETIALPIDLNANNSNEYFYLEVADAAPDKMAALNSALQAVAADPQIGENTFIVLPQGTFSGELIIPDLAATMLVGYGYNGYAGTPGQTSISGSMSVSRDQSSALNVQGVRFVGDRNNETDDTVVSVSGDPNFTPYVDFRHCTFSDYDVALDASGALHIAAQECCFYDNVVAVKLGESLNVDGNSFTFDADLFENNGTAIQVIDLPAGVTPYHYRVTRCSFVDNTDYDFDVAPAGVFYFLRNFYNGDAPKKNIDEAITTIITDPFNQRNWFQANDNGDDYYDPDREWLMLNDDTQLPTDETQAMAIDMYDLIGDLTIDVVDEDETTLAVWSIEGSVN